MGITGCASPSSDGAKVVPETEVEVTEIGDNPIEPTPPTPARTRPVLRHPRPGLTAPDDGARDGRALAVSGVRSGRARLQHPEPLGAGDLVVGKPCSPSQRVSESAPRFLPTTITARPPAAAGAARSAAARAARPCRRGSAGSTRSRRTPPPGRPRRAGRARNRSATPSRSAFSRASSSARSLTSTAVTRASGTATANGQADDAVAAAEVEHLARLRRRRGLAQQHAGADVEPAAGEDARAGGRLQPVAPDVGAHRHPGERRARVRGEVVLLGHAVPLLVRRRPAGPVVHSRRRRPTFHSRRHALARVRRPGQPGAMSAPPRRRPRPTVPDRDPDPRPPPGPPTATRWSSSAGSAPRPSAATCPAATARHAARGRRPAAGAAAAPGGTVDVIDVACWTKRTQRTARPAGRRRRRPGRGCAAAPVLRRRGRPGQPLRGGGRAARAGQPLRGSVLTARDSRARAARSASAG